MFICNHWFHSVPIQQSSGEKKKKKDFWRNRKNRKDAVKRMLTLELRRNPFLSSFLCV